MTTGRVRLSTRLSSSFRTTSGVRQGCVLAPALFCCAMDYIMKWVVNGAVIQVGDQVFTDLDYADDAVLFTASEDQLHDVLQRMESEASKFGLHVSWAKTKLQNLGSGSPVTPISIGAETVESVDHFCYLGSTVTSLANSRDESVRRIGIASSNMQRLDRVWKQRNLSVKTKFRIYTCFVLSILLYACETWTLTSTEWDKLEAFHTRSQRRILNIKWSDFITNDEVYTRSGLESLHSIVRRRRLGLFGHIARMPADVPAMSALRLAVRAREGDLTAFGWHRPRGRPPTTWLHQICSDCELKPSAALECAQDRSVWRVIATAEQATRVDWLTDRVQQRASIRSRLILVYQRAYT